jgi:DNA polymerase IV
VTESVAVAGSPVRRILLADADAFFVAVARREDPEGAGRARLLIVGGRPGSRGVVCSASYEARAFGVRSAMPISRALRLCPDALCVPVPRGACSRLSRAIAAVLGRFTPVVESASIDEWYLDLTGTEALYRHEPLADTAGRIRDAVQTETGLSVSLGGGTNRLLAKLAVEFAKPRPGGPATGVYVVEPGAEAAFMQRIRLADIPGVGPRFRSRLEAAGLRSVGDALAPGRPALERAIGARDADWLWPRLHGVGTHTVAARDRSRSLSREETLDHDIADDRTLERLLLELSTQAASDLRSHRLAARTISVKLRDADFRTRRASRTLPVAVVGDRLIHETALALLRRLRNARRVPARLLGVALTSLQTSAGDTQYSLLAPAPEESDTDRDRLLARTVDKVRARYGRTAIGPGALTTNRRNRS